MTYDQTKPAREWWILENQQAMFLSGLIGASPIKCLDGIHVIEYSAFEKLEAELKTCYERKIFSHRKCEEERDQLRAENDLLREDAQRLYTQYMERGAAMRETGNIVRSLYVGSEVSKRITALIQDRDQLCSGLAEYEAEIKKLKAEKNEK